MSIARRTLILMVVPAVTLLIAALAAAAPLCSVNPRNENCIPDPPDPTTTTTDPTTTTTTEAGPPGAMPNLSFAELAIYDPDYEVPYREWRPEYDPDLDEWVLPVLSITMTPDSTVFHVDLWNGSPGQVTVTVTDPGRAGSVSANLRDSHPGDHCLSPRGADLKKGESVFVLPGDGNILPGTRDTVVEVIPPATTNACGTETPESDIDEDGEVIFTTWEQTGTPDPLAMALWYGNGPATTVEVTLRFEAVPPPQP